MEKVNPDSATISGSPQKRPEISLLHYLLYIPFALAFLLLLVVFDPLQRIAFKFGISSQQKVVNWLNYFLARVPLLLGIRVQIHGEVPPRLDKPLLIISNHQSLFDIPILHSLFSSYYPRFVAKKELAQWLPSVSFNLRNGGSAVIDRSDPRQAIPEIKAFSARLQEQKFAAVIFPEGTRAKDGVLKPFKTTGVSTLIDNATDAEILPVVIDNSWMLSLFPAPLGTTVKVKILPKISRAELGAKQLVQQAETVIAEGLKALRLSDRT